jgi:hypothetical protein
MAMSDSYALAKMHDTSSYRALAKNATDSIRDFSSFAKVKADLESHLALALKGATL